MIGETDIIWTPSVLTLRPNSETIPFQVFIYITISSINALLLCNFNSRKKDRPHFLLVFFSVLHMLPSSVRDISNCLLELEQNGICSKVHATVNVILDINALVHLFHRGNKVIYYLLYYCRKAEDNHTYAVLTHKEQRKNN